MGTIEKKVNTQIIPIFVFVVLAVVLFFFFDSRKNREQQQHLQLITERYQLAYNTVYDQHKQLATTIHSGLIKRYDIPRVYQDLLTADEARKKRLREELLTRIMPRYKELNSEVRLRLIHFHLRNNESFLRLHKPEKFGDNLTGIRETVAYVNKEHLPVDGFEEGKFYNGYRFVFPITAADQTHLGSMEISFGPEALTSSLMEEYAVLCNFLIKKTAVKNKVWPEEAEKKYTKSAQKDFLYDKKVLAALKKLSHQDLKGLQAQKHIAAMLSSNAFNGRAMSLYDPSVDMVFTALPVVNPVTENIVAIFSVRSYSAVFQNGLQNFRIIFSLSLLLLGVILSSFYLQYNKKKELEANKEQLEKQKEQLKEAQKIANLGHWELDSAADKLSWSDQLFCILGLGPQERTPNYELFLENVHPDDRDFVNKSYIEAIKNRKSCEIQYRLTLKDGTEKWIRDICTTTFDVAGNPLRSLGVVHDITSQKEQEQVQLQISRQKEELKRFESLKTMAGAIAHRFNNSMMVVEGNLHLLTPSFPEDSEEYKIVSDASQAARGASKVGSMMLSYVGQQSVQFQETSFSDLVKEKVNAFSSLFRPTLSLKFTPPAQPLYCSMDQQQIKEVIESILSNAVESLGDDHGTIEITFGAEYFTADSFPIPFQNDQLQDGMYMFCEITDSGHGISQEKLQRIFEPFFTTRFIGRGLGLALTVGIMRMHHGAIMIESIPDMQTSVRVLLPLFKPASQ